MTKKTSATPGMDFADFDTTETAEKGAPMTVYRPDNGEALVGPDGREVTITLAGTDSETYQKAQRSILNKRMAKRGRAGGKLTAEEVEAEAIDLLARCTLGWDGVVVEGEALPCNLTNAKALYTRFPWVKEQADAFVGDRANFLGNC